MALAEKINDAIAAGKTVTIATAWRAITVKAKHVAQWKAAGFDFFITDSDGATRMISRTSKGKPVYEIIDGCRVTAV